MDPADPSPPTHDRSRLRESLPLLLILLLFAAWATRFILRTSFLLDGHRYFCLFDDMMISMRYARNLADGYGLIFNPGGERIEGYSNPLWTLYMALPHLLRLPDRLASLPVQVTGLALLALNVTVVGGLTRRLPQMPAFGAPVAMALTAFDYPLNNWGLQGTEVALLAALSTAAVWLAWDCVEGKRGPGALYLTLGVMTLVRMDMAPLAGLFMLAMLWQDRSRRRQHLASGAWWIGGCLAAQVLCRLVYYGAAVPNTYYLKLVGYPVGWRLARGLVAWGGLWLSTPVASVLLLVALPFALRDRLARWLLLAAVAQSLYSIYVGGDAWEHAGGTNRYLSPAVPGVMVGFVYGAVSLLRRLAQWLRQSPALDGPTGRLCAMVLLPLGLLSMNATGGRMAWRDASLQESILHVGDNRHWVEIGLATQRVTDPQATIGVVTAGSIPYFSHRTAIDLLGKSDRVIAHRPMRIIPGRSALFGFYPGHMKWDYGYSIGQLRPDLVLQLWHAREEATPTLDALYVPASLARDPVWAKRGSAHVRWRELKRESEGIHAEVRNAALLAYD